MNLWKAHYSHDSSSINAISVRVESKGFFLTHGESLIDLLEAINANYGSEQLCPQIIMAKFLGEVRGIQPKKSPGPNP